MITKLTTDLNNIQGLDAEPNDVQGLTFEVFQGKFDKAGNDIKDYINNSLSVEIDAKSAAQDSSQSSADANLQSQITINGGAITTLQGRVTTNESNIGLKANVVDVYSKTELAPYLSGGDTLIKYEVFTIVNSNNGNGTFTYTDKNNNSIVGNLDVNGYEIFTLLEGTYPVGQNRINVTINDTLQRSVASGGLQEIDITHVALTSPEGNGSEITIQYFERLGITNAGIIAQGTVAPPSDFYWFKEV